MAECNVTTDGFLSLDGTLDVSTKHKQLMLDPLGKDSIYES
jgi:hypothetical protein